MNVLSARRRLFTEAGLCWESQPADSTPQACLTATSAEQGALPLWVFVLLSPCRGRRPGPGRWVLCPWCTLMALCHFGVSHRQMWVMLKEPGICSLLYLCHTVRLAHRTPFVLPGLWKMCWNSLRRKKIFFSSPLISLWKTFSNWSSFTVSLFNKIWGKGEIRTSYAWQQSRVATAWRYQGNRAFSRGWVNLLPWRKCHAFFT